MIVIFILNFLLLLFVGAALVLSVRRLLQYDSLFMFLNDDIDRFLLMTKGLLDKPLSSNQPEIIAIHNSLVEVRDSMAFYIDSLNKTRNIDLLKKQKPARNRPVVV